MAGFLIPVAGYLPAILWLVVVTVAGLVHRRIPLAAVAVATVIGIAVNVAVNGWIPAGVAVAAGLVIIGGMLLLGILTRSSLVILPVLLLSMPVLAWVALIPGYVVAGAVSAYRLRKVAGSGYVSMVAAETISGVGGDPMAQTPLGASKPDTARIPLVDETMGEWSASVAAVKVRLSGYLLAGVALTAGLAFFVG